MSDRISDHPDASMATCMLCKPPLVVGAGILDHLRLFHPDEYGDGPECWPDGGFVITYEDGAVEPEDFADPGSTR